MASSDLDYEFLSPLDGETPALLFRRMVAREELGRLPEYRLELLRETKLPAIKAAELVGAKVDIKIRIDKSSNRYINGYVTRLERGGVVGRYDVYQVLVQPWLWQLTLGADCKIFQNESALDVIKAVFAGYSQAGTVKTGDVSGAKNKRPYTAQYRETDFNFVLRLMEEEGIHFYFTHEKGSHTLVLTDQASTHPTITGSTLRWAPAQLGEQLSEDVITEWAMAHQLGSLQFSSTDYAAEQPTLSLATQASRTVPYSKGPSGLKVFDYPGDFGDVSMDGSPDSRKTVGNTWAQHQVDRYESGRVVAVALSPYRHCSAGVTFSLSDHPDAGGYLITALDMEVRFTHYEARDSEAEDNFLCRFEVVPKTTAYRPPAIARRALVHGPQTATVTGESGDEIMTDQYGRVKVQFRWDRVGKSNQDSSCWLRVSQPWAGKQFGMIALPRVGDEVIVEFLEGNPDRPLITGRVYNGVNKPPYTLPAQATVSGIKTQSSKGGSLTTANELRFDDKNGSEYVWFQAQKDMHSWVKNDQYASVLNNYWGDVAKNYSLTVGGTSSVALSDVVKLQASKDVHLTLGADLYVSTGAALGVSVSDAIAVKGSSSVAVSSAQSMDLKSDQTLQMTATSALSIKGMNVTIEADTQITIKAGAATITLGPAGVTIDGPMVKINCGGGGGSATAAAAASPPSPQAPEAPTKNKDPLAAGTGGSGAGS